MRAVLDDELLQVVPEAATEDTTGVQPSLTDHLQVSSPGSTRHFILELMVDGYTIPAIIDRLRRRAQDRAENGELTAEVPYGELVKLYQDNYQAIRDARVLKEQDFKERGLGTRLGRAQRLEKLAEALEPLALKSPAYARAYADVLAKLDGVMEPVDKTRVPESDEWIQHLNKLKGLPAPTLDQDSHSVGESRHNEQLIEPDHFIVSTPSVLPELVEKMGTG